MSGYFGIGIDGVSKKGNIGNLVRTANAFGAHFAFAVAACRNPLTGESPLDDFADTSKSYKAMPVYSYAAPDEVPVPADCRLVGVEMADDAVELPVFRHPHRAIYVLGAERYSLSDAMVARCHEMITIPTRFSLNVATAGAIVMYDRMRLLGGYPDRPTMPGRRAAERPPHRHGGPISRTAAKQAGPR
ncbi:TrmH family RNA methyltransferase [Yunchengibacter salinarum]|uniref:TrmH family RNA methyltransferase n=1 Tax=Yunchengibacter salinarum TaxID=3133399 RepID=UPI0035B5AA1C